MYSICWKSLSSPDIRVRDEEKWKYLRGKATGQTFHHLPVSSTSESSKKSPENPSPQQPTCYRLKTYLHPRRPQKYSRLYKSTVVCLNVRDITFIANAPQGEGHNPSHWFQRRWERMWSKGHPEPQTQHTENCYALATSTVGGQETRINPLSFYSVVLQLRHNTTFKNSRHSSF